MSKKSGREVSQQKAKRPLGFSGVIICVLSSLFLAISFVYAGFEACATPDITTRLLASAFSNDADSPFTKEQLIDAAVISKDYTVGSHNQQETLDMLATLNGLDTPASMESLAELDDTHTLTADALSHLDDVFYVVQDARVWLRVICALAIFLCIVCAFTGGKRRLGSVLFWTGWLVIGIFACLGLWVAIDFNGFFAAFHSLFFAAGTWTFAWDSLLICMYPPNFWIGMGAVWLVVTVALSVAAIIIGNRLRKA
ncbi:DUF1461 domain-containing protein [Eggerthellaceae bacterium 3-80]